MYIKEIMITEDDDMMKVEMKADNVDIDGISLSDTLITLRRFGAIIDPTDEESTMNDSLFPGRPMTTFEWLIARVKLLEAELNENDDEGFVPGYFD